jgi:hypothetical protein
MVKQDIKKYSDLASWLLYDLPNLPYYKPKVWTAFTRHAGLLSGYSIMWGFSPVIKVDAGQMLECKETGAPQRQKDGSYIQRMYMPWHGFTVPTKGVNEIYVASDLARGAGSPQVGPILEATVLHELVHWCRKIMGKDVNDEDAPYAFEEEAYGKRMFRTWETCMSKQYFITN